MKSVLSDATVVSVKEEACGHVVRGCEGLIAWAHRRVRVHNLRENHPAWCIALSEGAVAGAGGLVA